MSLITDAVQVVFDYQQYDEANLTHKVTINGEKFAFLTKIIIRNEVEFNLQDMNFIILKSIKATKCLKITAKSIIAFENYFPGMTVSQMISLEGKEMNLSKTKPATEITTGHPIQMKDSIKELFEAALREKNRETMLSALIQVWKWFNDSSARPQSISQLFAFFSTRD